MFSLPEQQSIDLSLATEVMHFGASYIGVEHEWKYWLEQFEGLLRKMYWVSATVPQAQSIGYSNSLRMGQRGRLA